MISMDNIREKYIPRKEGISDEEYTRKIVQFAADLAEKKKSLLRQKQMIQIRN